jgi:hypothetical protein
MEVNTSTYETYLGAYAITVENIPEALATLSSRTDQMGCQGPLTSLENLMERELLIAIGQEVQ